MIIPYSTNENSFKILNDKKQFYCSLDAHAVMQLSKAETIALRDHLEEKLSEQEKKKMELGFAEYAIDKFGKLAVLCYFKETVA